MTLNASRRNFLSWSARMAALGTGAPFALNLAALGAASAQTANDYKALVCIFLYGGNDNHNTVIPYDAASYAGYQTARGGIARRAQHVAAPDAGYESGGTPIRAAARAAADRDVVRRRPRCDRCQRWASVASNDPCAISESFSAAAAEAVFA